MFFEVSFSVHLGLIMDFSFERQFFYGFWTLLFCFPIQFYFPVQTLYSSSSRYSSDKSISMKESPCLRTGIWGNPRELCDILISFYCNYYIFQKKINHLYSQICYVSEVQLFWSSLNQNDYWGLALKKFTPHLNIFQSSNIIHALLILTSYQLEDWLLRF